MIVAVERFGHGKDSTLGTIVVPGMLKAYTLEDEGRAKKVKGETRIPEGAYRVTLRTEGGFHMRYAKRFPRIHKGMLWLRDVPGFEYILIHCGNTDSDTMGCILLGEAFTVVPGGYKIVRSTDAYKRLYPPMAEAAAADDLVVEVKALGVEP